jgi:c-di-GMP-binding flagellar brake protein YcgR
MTGSKKIMDSVTQTHETITSAARISSLLKPLENKIDLLTLTLPNTDTSYKSTLLSVDTNKKLLVLDRLTPKGGHEQLIKSRQLTIQVSHKGAEIIFTTTMNETEPEKIMPRYELNFPDSIQYLHRRNSYRVTVRNNSEMVVEIQTNNKSFQGELHNISTEGMCIRFPNEIGIPRDNDQTEVQCVINLADNQELKCTFNICHTYLHQHSKDFRIGGNFQYLDKIQKRAIEKFVAELQRKSQKTMVR